MKRISEDAHGLACRINIGKMPILPTAIYKSTDSMQFPILVLERTILNIIWKPRRNKRKRKGRKETNRQNPTQDSYNNNNNNSNNAGGISIFNFKFYCRAIMIKKKTAVLKEKETHWSIGLNWRPRHNYEQLLFDKEARNTEKRNAYRRKI